MVAIVIINHYYYDYITVLLLHQEHKLMMRVLAIFSYIVVCCFQREVVTFPVLGKMTRTVLSSKIFEAK